MPPSVNSTEPPVLLERGPVTTLRLNRPEKFNAMTPEMGEALAELVPELNQDPRIRAVVIRGNGKAFCAGGDFTMLEENTRRSPEENRRNMVRFYGLFLSLLDLHAPTVAVLHGATVGAGLCLALACDLRLADQDAKLGANFVRVGLHPGMGASLTLPALIGRSRAAELLLTGKLVSGSEAAQLGVVNEAVPAGALEARVETLLADLLKAAPIAAAQTKATLTAGLRRDLWAALEREAACQAVDFTTRDLKEAVTSFRERKQPSFSGT